MTQIQIPSQKTLTFSAFPEIQKEELSIFEKALKPEYSDRTKKIKIFDVMHFVRWYVTKNPNGFYLQKVNERDLKDYQDYCKKEHQALSTIQRKLSSLKVLYAAGESLGKIQKNPMTSIKTVIVQVSKNLSESKK